MDEQEHTHSHSHTPTHTWTGTAKKTGAHKIHTQKTHGFL